MLRLPHWLSERFSWQKVEKASKVKGTRYIHVIAPCPTGWGIATDETVEIAKEVVDCGLWYLAEYEDGEFTLNHNPRHLPMCAIT